MNNAQKVKILKKRYDQMTALHAKDVASFKDAMANTDVGGLEYLANANIKFLSAMASIELKKRKNNV